MADTIRPLMTSPIPLTSSLSSLYTLKSPLLTSPAEAIETTTSTSGMAPQGLVFEMRCFAPRHHLQLRAAASQGLVLLSKSTPRSRFRILCRSSTPNSRRVDIPDPRPYLPHRSHILCSVRHIQPRGCSQRARTARGRQASTGSGGIAQDAEDSGPPRSAQRTGTTRCSAAGGGLQAVLLRRPARTRTGQTGAGASVAQALTAARRPDFLAAATSERAPLLAGA